MSQRPEDAPRRSRKELRNVTEPAAVTGTHRVVSAALNPPRRMSRKLMISCIVLIALMMVSVPAFLSRLGVGALATSSPSPSGYGTSASVQSGIQVSGRVGATPVVSLHGALPYTDQTEVNVAVSGDGAKIAAGSPVLLSISTFSGADGSNTTATDSGVSLFLGRLNADALGETLAQTLQDVTEGSRVVLSAPDEAADSTMKITVVDVLYTQAVGEKVTAQDGFPAIKMANDGTVSVDMKGLKEPKTSNMELLIRGSGQQVSAKSVLVARSAMFSWDTGKPITSSWGNDVLPGTIDMTNALTGIEQYLVDIPVGSRVVLTLTADQARGDEPVVLVIDILAISGSRD